MRKYLFTCLASVWYREHCAIQLALTLLSSPLDPSGRRFAERISAGETATKTKHER